MIDDDLLKFDLIRIIEKLFQILDKNAFTMEGKKTNDEIDIGTGCI